MPSLQFQFDRMGRIILLRDTGFVVRRDVMSGDRKQQTATSTPIPSEDIFLGLTLGNRSADFDHDHAMAYFDRNDEKIQESIDSFYGYLMDRAAAKK